MAKYLIKRHFKYFKTQLKEYMIENKILKVIYIYIVFIHNVI